MQKIAILAVIVAVISIGKSQLTSKSVYDGPCPASIQAYSGTNTIWTHTPRNYFIPFGSKNSYRTMFEIFNNRSAANDAELQTMAPKEEWGLLTSTFTDSSSNKVVFTCLPQLTATSVSLNQVQCQLQTSSSAADTTPISYVTATVVLTDNNSYIMVYGCNNITNTLLGPDYTYSIRQFAVLSVNNTLSSDAQTAVTNKAGDLGFNPAYNQNYTY